MEKTSEKLGLILKYFDDFTETQIKQFAALEELYNDWNSKINVISRKDIDSIYLHHVLHSLSIAAIANFEDGSSVVDIGCGGGFPSIPLAIFFPKVKFHLIDSIGKKLKVVEAITEAIGINNITIQHTRAEELKNRKFDFAVSRGVAPLKDLCVWSMPLLKKGHTQHLPNGLICLKGGDLAQEIFESGVRPKIVHIHHLFKEDYFDEKVLLHVTK